MKKLFFFSILALLSLTMHAQHFDWVRGWSGYGGSSDSGNPGNVIKGSVVDSEGNVYVVGEYFPGTKVFGVDPVPLDIATVSTNRSVVIAKINPEGILIWHKAIYSDRIGGDGPSVAKAIRLLGDTAIMVSAITSLPDPDNQHTALYYLDTIIGEISFTDTVTDNRPSCFITLDLSGNLLENHFLYQGALDNNGNRFFLSNREYVGSMMDISFDVDNDGNIYLINKTNMTFSRPDDTSSSTIENGKISAIRIIVDGLCKSTYIPQHQAARWNKQILKFSPHFERLVNSIYVFDSTDVYSESDIFLHPSTGIARKPSIEPTSFRIDEQNNVYLLLNQYWFGSHMPLSNSDTLAFTGHDHDYYADLLIKYDSSLTPLFAKQLRSTYGTDDPNQCQRWFLTGSVGFDVETNTVYVSGKLQKNFMGATDNEAVQIYYDSDTLDLKNNFFWLRLDRDNGSLVSYGKVQSGFQSEILTSNSAEPNLGISNGKVAATFNYRNDFTFADTTIYSGNSYNFAQAMAIWDDEGNEIACYDFNAIHDYNRTGGVHVHDSTLYVTGVVYTGATFGDTVLASTGGRSQAFIAKYVNPIFAQSGSSERLPQHITWEQELDFIAQPSPIALNAYASSGLPIHYTSSDPDVAYIDGGNLFYAGEGDATVTATQPGNYIYLAAEPVTKPVITPSGHNPGGDGIQQAADGRQQAAVSVYPNPTSGVVHIDTDGAAITTVTLHNAMGQTVATDTIKQSNNHTTIDLSPLPAGVYYLTVRSGETTARHKIIKVAK